MTALCQALDDYLALRRALGFALRSYEPALRNFAAFLARAGTETITTRHALAWATQPTACHPLRWAQRLTMVRGFAAYRQASDLATEVPPADALACSARRHAPHLYTDEEIQRLLAAAERLHGAHGGPAAPYATMLGLFAATGLRANEALALDRADVDLEAGVLQIRCTKFRKTRLVPLHSTTTAALGQYAQARDRHPAGPCTTRFFVNAREHRPCTYRDLWLMFRRLACTAGLRDRTGRQGPRLHDFRHSFAVRTLTGWHRAGLDVDAQLPRLSTYLGHTHPTYTYWYLSATPELLGSACARLDRALGVLP
jgi:integrase